MEAPATTNERELYPLHEEDNLPEPPAHEREMNYLMGAVRSFRPALAVHGNFAMYWKPREFNQHVGPDLVVLAGPMEDWSASRVWLAWEDPAPLLVGEIASRRTRRSDIGSKFQTYESVLCVPEYLYIDLERRILRLHRLIDGRYVDVVPDENGRLWSAQLQRWFGWDEEGFVSIYNRDGQRIPGHEEAVAQWQEAERQRQEAEARADEEAQKRAELERRLAELTAQLAAQANPDTSDDPA